MAVTEQIVEANEAICEARPVPRARPTVTAPLLREGIIGQRLKCSGMHWTVNGPAPSTTLRCHQASCPADHIWQRPRYQTGAT